MKARNSLLILAILSSLSVVAAFIGFGAVASDYSWSTRAYLSFQLFTFQGGEVEGAVPWSLELARFLAPATTLGGLFAAALAFFVNLGDGMRLRFIGGHTIVCGGGAKGSALAAELAEDAGARVVLVDRAELAAGGALRRRGVLAIRGDGGDAAVMAQAGLARAARLVCVAGDDRTNIGIALAAADRLPAERVQNPLEIHVHVGDVARRNILQRSQLLDLKHDPRHRIRLFNSHANRARLTLAANPLEWDADGNLHNEVHLVVGALGRFEKALLVHAAHIGHFRNGGKVQVHLVSTRAPADGAALLKEYPGFRRCSGLEVVPIGETDGFVDTIATLVGGWGPSSMVTVLPEGGAESGLADALLLRERLKGGPNLRILLDAQVERGIRGMVEKNAMLAPWIRFLPDLSAGVGREAVFQQSLDGVAGRIHDTWRRGNDEAIRSAEAAGDAEAVHKLRAKETYRDWQDLTEEQKDVNRLAADHLPVKIRALGMDPAHSSAVKTAWATLGADQLEILSRMEHERWAAPLWMAGWTSGPRNDDLKIHPNLVPYDALDEETRKYDRDQVLALPGFWQSSPPDSSRSIH